MALGTVYACLRCHMYQSDSTELAATPWKLVLEASHRSASSCYLTWVLIIGLFGPTATLVHMLLEHDIAMPVTSASPRVACLLAFVKELAIEQKVRLH